MRSLLLHVVGIVWLLLLALVSARFFTLLLHADDSSEVVARIYRHSEFWVKPFSGAFDLSNPQLPVPGTFETASVTAFVVYLVGGIFVLGLLGADWRDGKKLKRPTDAPGVSGSRG